MDPLATAPKESAKSQAIKRELARRANDQIKVHNPTSEPYEVMWDGWKFTVPSAKEDNGNGKGNTVLPRYIARNYVIHMSDKLMTKEADDAVSAVNATRKKRGQEPLNKWEDEDKIQTPILKNEEKRANCMWQLWIGVTKEYGLENVPEGKRAPADRRPLAERIIDEIETGAGTETEAEMIKKMNTADFDEESVDDKLSEVAE